MVRMFYLDRVMRDVMSMHSHLSPYFIVDHRSIPDHGGPVETDMFARHPDHPIPSKPSPKRKIRCKMCRYVKYPRRIPVSQYFPRQELATREHMLDHGQLGPSSPFPVSPNMPPPQNSTNTPGMSSHAAYPQNPSETSQSRDGNPHVPVVSESPTAVQAQASLHSTEVVLGTSPVILPDNSGAINSLPIQGTKPLILSDPKCSGYFVEPVRHSCMILMFSDADIWCNR